MRRREGSARAAGAAGPASLFRTTLSNGLTVILRPERAQPVVSVWCWYRVGSRDERPGLTGISHWVEHMNFKGTRRIPKSEVTRQVELAGGTWNGYTWLDVTTYFETVRSDALEAMLRLEASRMTECLYSLTEVERERTVVISELQGGENDPRTYLEREVVGCAIQAHPYRWPTIGYLSDLQAITREDLYRHYRTFYVPNNAILVISGDFAIPQALKLVRRHFGRIPRGDVPPPVRTTEPEQCGERRVVVRRPSGATYLHIACPAPAVTEPDFAALLVADGILAGGASLNIWSGHQGHGPSKSSRLYRALVEKDLAVEVGAQVVATRHPFLYSIQATVKDGVDPKRVEEAIVSEIERLGRGVIEERDIGRSKNQLLARHAFDNESVTDMAHQLGFFETLGDHHLGSGMPDRVRAVTVDDVARLVRARAGETHRTVGLLLPAPARQDAP